MAKARRRALMKGTTMNKAKRQAIERPADLPEYQETNAEKAARQRRVGQIEARTYSDGMVKYCVPGLEPDTGDTLEAAGLIKRHYNTKGKWVSTTVFWPGNLRVRAWQVGLNQLSASLGVPPPFPELDLDALDGTSRGSV
jgi:hypothetical protein